MEWSRFQPYQDEHMVWISGIYKVVTYDGKHFHAYYIKDSDKNWGWNPSNAPCTDNIYHSRFWPSLESAQKACEEHVSSHRPKPATVKRAAELLEQFRQEEPAGKLGES